MSVEELLQKLGLDLVGSYSDDGSYVIDLADSREFGKVYSTLEDSELVSLLEDSTTLTEHNGSIQYEYEDMFMLTLTSDFDGDIYKLVIREI